MNIINMDNDELTWDLSNLTKYCPMEDIDNGKIYVFTFVDKIKRIRYAINEITNQPPLSNSRDFPVFRLKSLIFLESIAYNLHSLADVLAHIISIFILTPQIIEPRKISINTIKGIIEDFKNNTDMPWKRVYYEKLFDSIENLTNSEQFSYIAAFVNTIKHRNLIPESLHTTIDEEGHCQKWIFDEFEKDGHYYQKMDQESFFECSQIILDLYIKIGSNIDNYCRAKWLS